MKHSSIKCTLCCASLQQRPAYDALSYVWGDQTTKRPIQVNGRLFGVTENLKSALRHLRYWDERKRVIWIDALCINQADIPERNQQVRQMDDIYRNAAKVVVWLGPETNTSSEAFDWLAGWGALRQSYSISSSKQQDQAVDTAGTTPGSGLASPAENPPTKDFSRSQWDHILHGLPIEPIRKLFQRPWWQRIWVIQEVAHASKVEVLCGYRSMDWAILCQGISILSAFSMSSSNSPGLVPDQRLHSIFTNFIPIHSICGTREGSQNLLDLLEGTADYKATDPRDKIFALLSLLPEGSDEKRLIVPDYSMDLSHLQISVTRHLLELSRKLDVLACLQDRDILVDNSLRASPLPSWVPGFGKVIRRRSVFVVNIPPPGINYARAELLAETIMYRASLDPISPIPFSFSTDSRILRVRGVVVDSVLQLGRPAPPRQPYYRDRWKGNKMDLASKIRILRDWRTMFDVDCTTSYSYSAQPRREVFWRTIFADRDEEHDTLGLTRISAEFLGSPFPPQTAEDEEELFSKLERPVNVSRNRYVQRRYGALDKRFFLSQKGYVGLCPTSTCKGDVIAVLLGGKMPFVLRPLNDSQPTYYTVVGER